MCQSRCGCTQDSRESADRDSAENDGVEPDIGWTVHFASDADSVIEVAIGQIGLIGTVVSVETMPSKERSRRAPE